MSQDHQHDHDHDHNHPHAPALTRRSFLQRSSSVTLASAITVTSAGALLNSAEAWALDVKALKPQTMKTLILLARDIYPHDRIADRFYAIAVKGHDEKAGKDAALDKAAGGKGYLTLGWEEERVKLLRKIEGSPFFQTVRSGLVVSLYNQQEVWPILGYEGESYSKGGYIERGFNDIDWL